MSDLLKFGFNFKRSADHSDDDDDKKPKTGRKEAQKILYAKEGAAFSARLEGSVPVGGSERR